MRQCHIHIIESTDADQFTFSTTVSDPAISDQLILEFDLTVLFRRCAKKITCPSSFCATSASVSASAAPMTPASCA